LNHSLSGQPKISEEMATFTPTPDAMKEAIPWNCGLDQELPAGAKIIRFVEDEAFVRNVTAEVLRSPGYRVLTARNAEEALVAYREYRVSDIGGRRPCLLAIGQNVDRVVFGLKALAHELGQRFIIFLSAPKFPSETQPHSRNCRPWCRRSFGCS
jgi:CheY-like chemotaxis protein